MKIIFLDTEFTGLIQSTQLISLALVADTGETFYAEFTDYDLEGAVDWQWILDNVLSNLTLDGTDPDYDISNMRIRDNSAAIRSAIRIWLNQFGEIQKDKEGNIIPHIQIWADVPHYDWVLFCELFGGARHIPTQIHFMPMDLATLLHCKGIKNDFPRTELLDKDEIPEGRQHNALFDAKVGMEVLKKMDDE